MLSVSYSSNFRPTSSTLIPKSCIGYPVNNSDAILKRNFRFPVAHLPSNSPVAHLPSNSIRVPTSGTIDHCDNFWLHEVELEVRDYELDQFGIVNNANYASYCEHCHAKLLEKISLAGGDIGGAVALQNLSLRFIAPLQKGDKFLIKHRVTRWSGTRLFMEHFIVKLHKQEPILKASATAVWLDTMYRPQRIAPDVLSYVIKQSPPHYHI